ncbi:P-loop containing nucleoside triphosphate hydrolase protein [Plectosphaerella cucumerina]|uniref:P-loop containing nucleoside triphosphate hydrolase protein n=1 Tax=Plectosphaerella cucumerina TaxID=40658 RepID=A0A8K0X5J5_9PEZI|nr:P-loop containing nucleoside triphosphate hydrolase protein [Plectosphaerella cucumerina]
MGSLNISRDPASQLGSAKSSFRLNQIDKIRALGVGNHVSLPQIVVCGDQSAGKSSVLERLTEIPFPRQDGLCTRFATEIILRHTEGALEMVATVHADKSHDPERQRDLGAYRKNINDLADLPDIIDEVSNLIGLRGYGDSGGKAFSLDVLRIEVRGPTGLHRQRRSRGRARRRCRRGRVCVGLRRLQGADRRRSHMAGLRPAVPTPDGLWPRKTCSGPSPATRQSCGPASCWKSDE